MNARGRIAKLEAAIPAGGRMRSVVVYDPDLDPGGAAVVAEAERDGWRIGLLVPKPCQTVGEWIARHCPGGLSP